MEKLTKEQFLALYKADKNKKDKEKSIMLMMYNADKSLRFVREMYHRKNFRKLKY